VSQLIAGGLGCSSGVGGGAIVQRELKPGGLQICHRLPELQASQQALAAGVPAFRPYATLEDDDVSNCEADVQRDLAVR